jgi:hypothetical protein
VVYLSLVVNLIAQPVPPEAVAAPLTTEQKIRLRQLELEVERNLTGFIKCGRALLSIREERLWCGRYENFSDYCRERFAIARSTADQLCRSTQVFETLSASLAGSDTPVPETTPEIVLRPLTRLPTPELQTETWRLAASLSPEKKPTRTIAARVVRLVKDAIEPAMKGTKAADRDPMFVQPIQRLAKINSFDSALAVAHVTSPAQATRIIYACQTVAGRCQQIIDQLNQRF